MKQVNFSFDEAHRELLVNFLTNIKNGYFKFTDTSNRLGNFVQFIQYTFQIYQPFGKFKKEQMLSNVPWIDYEYAEQFFQFVLSGSTDLSKLKSLGYKIEQFEFKLPESFNTYYGPRIMNQLNTIINYMVKYPDTRRAVINILKDEDKQVWEINESPQNKFLEYPCTKDVQFLVDNKTLYTIVNMRANNAFNVVGYDVYNFMNLHNKVYDLLTQRGIVLKESKYIHTSASMHLFEKNFDIINNHFKF